MFWGWMERGEVNVDDFVEVEVQKQIGDAEESWISLREKIDSIYRGNPQRRV